MFDQLKPVSDIIDGIKFMTIVRLKQLWEDECNSSGPLKASIEWTMFRFIRTRFMVSTFFYLLCLTTGYLSSVSLFYHF